MSTRDSFDLKELGEENSLLAGVLVEGFLRELEFDLGFSYGVGLE